MDLVQTTALVAGVAWASGLNLYAAVVVLGVFSLAGWGDLPAGLHPLAHPAVIASAAFMYTVEFCADKIPGVDSLWDSLHTFIRPPAGAFLAAATVSEISVEAQLAAAILGGGLTAVVHATKAGGRALRNASPEPFSNWFASLVEDALVLVGLLSAILSPLVFFLLFGVFALAVIWLLPRLWSGLQRLYKLYKGAQTNGRATLAPGAWRSALHPSAESKPRRIKD